MKLSACIVVYNGYDEALKAAQTVLRFTRRHPLTLYLVDNASPDGSGQKLEAALHSGLLAAGGGSKLLSAAAPRTAASAPATTWSCRNWTATITSSSTRTSS